MADIVPPSAPDATPIEDPETKRLKIRNKILATLLEIDQPNAAALATLLSHRLVNEASA